MSLRHLVLIRPYFMSIPTHVVIDHVVSNHVVYDHVVPTMSSPTMSIFPTTTPFQNSYRFLIVFLSGNCWGVRCEIQKLHEVFSHSLSLLNSKSLFGHAYHPVCMCALFCLCLRLSISQVSDSRKLFGSPPPHLFVGFHFSIFCSWLFVVMGLLIVFCKSIWQLNFDAKTCSSLIRHWVEQLAKAQAWPELYSINPSLFSWVWPRIWASCRSSDKRKCIWIFSYIHPFKD